MYTPGIGLPQLKYQILFYPSAKEVSSCWLKSRKQTDLLHLNWQNVNAIDAGHRHKYNYCYFSQDDLQIFYIGLTSNYFWTWTRQLSSFKLLYYNFQLFLDKNLNQKGEYAKLVMVSVGSSD